MSLEQDYLPASEPRIYVDEKWGYAEARAHFAATLDPFDLNRVLCAQHRPAEIACWTDYTKFYGKVAELQWRASMDDPTEVVEADSPLDGVASGFFTEGWQMAIKRVATILGHDPKRLAQLMDVMGSEVFEGGNNPPAEDLLAFLASDQDFRSFFEKFGVEDE